jgi:hypothetical protein
MEPLFPVKALKADATDDAVRVVEPYRHEGTWVFDDPVVGLHREPFVAGITEMIDRLVANIPDAAKGFRLSFSANPFDGYQTTLTWLRSDPVEGNWYRADDSGDQGWLCPALFCYFSSPPSKVYVRAASKR